MAVAPGGLESIAADEIPAAKLKTLVAVTNSWPDDFTHHVRLAPARRARAGAAQEAERQKGLAPVIPLDGEFSPDLLDICRLEAHGRNLTVIRSAGQYFARRRDCAVLLPSGTTGITDPGFGSSSGVAGRIISVSFLRSCVPDSSCMSERRKPYPFDQLEPKWQALWEERRAFHAPNPGDPGFDPTRPKYYVLDMFPYSERRGAARRASRGLHRDRHRRALQAPARLQRSSPDRLGRLRFARRAIRHPHRSASGDHHPREHRSLQDAAEADRIFPTIGNARSARRIRISTAGRNGSFSRSTIVGLIPKRTGPSRSLLIAGDDPDRVRLAYVAEVPVNWCPELGTVLANEEVIDGKSEVGGFPVVRRPMRQWMLRITAFAERLIDELEPLDWPDGNQAPAAKLDRQKRRRA